MNLHGSTRCGRRLGQCLAPRLVEDHARRIPEFILENARLPSPRVGKPLGKPLFHQYPVQPKNLEITVPCEARTGGIMIYFPLSMLIAKGV